MENERWLQVVGYEGWYEVSDLGRIRRVMASKGTRPGKILKPTPTRKGHLGVFLSRDSVRRGVAVHQVVAAAFIGPRPEELQTRHLNGDPADNRAVNLAYGTPSENVQDSIRHGTNHNLAKTHCSKGHLYTPENTGRNPGNARRCKTCHRIDSRKRQRQQREPAAA